MSGQNTVLCCLQCSNEKQHYRPFSCIKCWVCACVQIAVLSDALEENGLDMDAILDAQMGGDDYSEEEGISQQGEEEQAASEGPDVEGEQ